MLFQECIGMKIIIILPLPLPPHTCLSPLPVSPPRGTERSVALVPVSGIHFHTNSETSTHSPHFKSQLKHVFKTAIFHLMPIAISLTFVIIFSLSFCYFSSMTFVYLWVSSNADKGVFKLNVLLIIVL